jgi:hypothetical protein
MDSSIIRKQISTHFGKENSTKFDKALSDNKAVIAGSYVLSCYTEKKYKPGDMDIYINSKNLNSFLIDMLVIQNDLFESICKNNINLITKDYDSSFLKQNGIKILLQLCSYNKRLLRNDRRLDIDIMVIEDHKNIIDVVTNFDLTFCEIWYDGKTIQSTDPKGVKKGYGFLRKQYVTKLYNENNLFLKERIEKYNTRGFVITIELNKSLKVDFIKPEKKLLPNTKDNNYLNKWVIKSILQEFCNIGTSNIKYFGPERRRYFDEIHMFIENSVKSKNLIKNIFKKVQHSSSQKTFIDNIFINGKHLTVIQFINSFTTFTYEEFFLNIILFFGFNSMNFFYKNLLELIDVCKYNNGKSLLSSELYKTVLEFKKIYDSYIKKYNNNNLTFILEQIKNFNFNINKEQSLKALENINSLDIGQIGFREGFDIINNEEINVNLFLKKDKDNFVIINIDENNEIQGTLLLYTLDTLLFYINDIEDNWFYNCNGNGFSNIDKTTPYIKIPTYEGNKFIYWNTVLDLVRLMKKYKNRYFIIKKEKIINFSASHKNAFSTNSIDFVGANHCQEESILNIYKLYNIDSSSVKSEDIKFKNIMKSKKYTDQKPKSLNDIKSGSSAALKKSYGSEKKYSTK